MKKSLIIAAFVVAAMALVAYGMHLKQEGNIAAMKQACVQKSQIMQQRGIVSDLPGFCDCTIKVRDLKTPGEIQAGGRACMNQYGKTNLLKMCEDMNVDMKKEEPTSTGIGCECFYEKLTNLFSDEVYARKGADNMTKDQRNEVVAKAFLACRNVK